MQQLRKDLVNLLRSGGREDEAKASAQEAEAFWGELTKNNPESADISLGSAQSRELAGNDPGALNVYSEGIKKWPQNPSFWLARGKIQMKRREYDQALSDISKALEIAPTDGAAPWWHLDRANVLGAMGRPSEALNELTAATKQWPNLFDTWVWRGNWYNDHREWTLAAADYSRAAELNPSYVQAWMMRASAYARLKRWKEAQSDYETALRLDGLNPTIRNDLAWFFATVPDVALRNPARAVELANDAVAREPGQGSLWNTLGVAQYRAGNWPAAIESLEKSNALLKGDHLSFNAFFLAMANWQLGQKEKAREWFKKAIDWMAQKAPDNEELLVFRVEAAALLGVAEVRNAPVEAQRPAKSSP